MMNEIFILDVPYDFGAGAGALHPAVLRDEHHTVLVDCAYPGQLPSLEAAMEAKGLSLAALTHVLITHQDHDHMGALAALKEKYPRIQIVAGKEEAPYIDGRETSLRLLQAEALQSSLPEEHRAWGLAFCETLRCVVPVPVDIEVEDGDVLPWCGGCTVIATPGHTPGHISLYAKALDLLLAGDAAVTEGETLAVANPQFALDLAQAERSLQKLLSYGAGEALCFHGGRVKIPPLRA